MSSRELTVQAPVISSPVDIALDVRIETLMAETYSNSQQVIYSASLNVSSVDRSLLVQHTGMQDIILQGSMYRAALNYTCSVTTSDAPESPILKVQARVLSQSQLACPIDTGMVSLASDGFYTLRLALNDQVAYRVTGLTVIARADLYSMEPPVIYQEGGNFKLQLRGSWSYYPTLSAPIVLVQTPENETLAVF